MQILPTTRHRHSRRPPLWIIVLVSMVCISLIGAYVYPPRQYTACYFFATCSPFTLWLPPHPARVVTDDEIAARVVFRDILKMTPVQSENPKIAFMFLTPEELPFERLWEKFFSGHEDRYSIYVHASRRKPDHTSPLFFNRDIRSEKWFSMKRQHALIVLGDSLYYNKFKQYCKPGLDGRNCYADEHYLPTLLSMVDPTGIANWSVTHVDWSEGKWHPKAYRAQDISYELVKNITSIDEITHVTSNKKKVVHRQPCLWNGVKRPCYLFARKFYPEALDNLLQHFNRYTRT